MEPSGREYTETELVEIAQIYAQIRIATRDLDANSHLKKDEKIRTVKEVIDNQIPGLKERLSDEAFRALELEDLDTFIGGMYIGITGKVYERIAR
jgi:DNA polymerase III delta prime subunit